MKEKCVYIIFIVLFVLSLFLPLIFIDIQGGKVSEQENRMLASRPQIVYAFEHPRLFIKQFDDWFSDNIGYREKMISFNKYINKIFSQQHYYLDGTSVVLIGKEGHHFHSHYNQLIPIYQGKPWLNDSQLSELSINLDEINQYLLKKNIVFIVMFCTDKESIYPEYYPNFIIRGPEPSSLDIVVDYLLKQTKVDLFCIKDRLLKEKEKFLVFPKIGDGWELCHYNETGSFFAYQELMKHINNYFPDLQSFSIESVNITVNERGISKVLPKQDTAFEQVLFDYPYAEYINVNTELPVLLLLRDSYADFFPNYLPQHFSNTIFHHWNTIERLDEYVNLYKPDIVVMEVAERAIPDFTKSINKYKLP